MYFFDFPEPPTPFLPERSNILPRVVLFPACCPYPLYPEIKDKFIRDTLKTPLPSLALEILFEILKKTEYKN